MHPFPTPTPRRAPARAGRWAVPVAVGLLLANLCRLKTTQHRVLLIVGVLVGGMTFHNLVHAAPQVFNRLFSPLWVAEVLRSTQPHSLLFRGISFVLKG